MRVLMTKSMPGSEDGIHIKRYEAGETYELGDDLAHSFLTSKAARPAPDKPEEPGAGSSKAGEGPRENK